MSMAAAKARRAGSLTTERVGVARSVIKKDVRAVGHPIAAI